MYAISMLHTDLFVKLAGLHGKLMGDESPVTLPEGATLFFHYCAVAWGTMALLHHQSQGFDARWVSANFFACVGYVAAMLFEYKNGGHGCYAAMAASSPGLFAVLAWDQL